MRKWLIAKDLMIVEFIADPAAVFIILAYL